MPNINIFNINYPHIVSKNIALNGTFKPSYGSNPWGEAVQV